VRLVRLVHREKKPGKIPDCLILAMGAWAVPPRPPWQAVVLAVAIEGLVGCVVAVARRSSHASVPPPTVTASPSSRSDKARWVREVVACQTGLLTTSAL
jgi:phosphatidylglycerophosphate synthase